jgi:signal transduction histidine kinase/DNA-binding response OmpR family regulator
MIIELNSQPRILIVDDNPTNIDLLLDCFDDAQFLISVAENGHRALEQVRYDLPDLILLDVMMPGMDGFEVCRHLKIEPDTKDIPIIFMTALADIDHKIEGFAAGAVDYVTKPFQAEEILARIQTHLDLRDLQKLLERQNGRLQEEIGTRKQAEKALQQINEELEDRVSQRTAALQAEISERVLLEEQLEAIYRLGQELTLLRQEPQIIQRVLTTATEVLDFEIAGCGLVDDEANELQYRYYLCDGQLKNIDMRLKLDGDLGIGVAVVHSQQVINLPDAAQDPHHVPMPDVKSGSELCVPMKAGDHVLGVLNAQRETADRFTDAEEKLLQTLANAAATALENARLYQAERDRRREIEAVQRAALSLTAASELSQVLDTIAHSAFDLVSGQDVHIFLYDQERLTFGTGMGFDGRQTGPLAEPRPGGLTYTVAQQGYPIHVTDMSTHPIFANAPSEWYGSILGLPLKIGDRVLGVMNVASRTSGGFAEGKLRPLQLLADQAVVAIENARLYERSQKEIADRKQAEKEATRYRMDLQKLSSQLINTQEDERKRISQELHDEIGQALTAISVNLLALEKKLPADILATVTEQLADMRGLTDEVMQQIRELSLRLRPSMLDDFGLISTLRWYTNRYQERLGIELVFTAVGLETRLPSAIETTLYRITQEALTNIARHAQATEVQVRLQAGVDTISILIEDNGQGFSPEQVLNAETPANHMGLLGMQERAAFIGGHLQIQSSPGQGTQLLAKIPFQS